MNHAFEQASKFNGAIERWDTNSVRTFQSTFREATSFNRDLSNWDLQSVVTIEQMFQGASRLNQSLCWDALTTRGTAISMPLLGNIASSWTSLTIDNAFCESPVSLDPCCFRNHRHIIEETCCGGSDCFAPCTAFRPLTTEAPAAVDLSSATTDRYNTTAIPTTTATTDGDNATGVPASSATTDGDNTTVMNDDSYVDDDETKVSHDISPYEEELSAISITSETDGDDMDRASQNGTFIGGGGKTSSAEDDSSSSSRGATGEEDTPNGGSVWWLVGSISTSFTVFVVAIVIAHFWPARVVESDDGLTTNLQGTSMQNTSFQNTSFQNTSFQNTSFRITSMPNTSMQPTGGGSSIFSGWTSVYTSNTPTAAADADGIASPLKRAKNKDLDIEKNDQDGDDKDSDANGSCILDLPTHPTDEEDW